MRSKYSAYDIATWFIWKNSIEQTNNEIDEEQYEVYEGLSHLKVQKLLYYAQGVSLAANGVPLFDEKIVAWPHGPVVKEVYKEFEKFGRTDIPESEILDNIDNIQIIANDIATSEILDIVYENFGGYTAWQLREKTHEKGAPWQTVVDTKGMGKVISNEMIRRYFIDHIVENG